MCCPSSFFYMWKEVIVVFYGGSNSKATPGGWRLNHMYHCNLNFLVWKIVRNFWVFVLFYFSSLWYPVRAAANTLSHQVFGIMALRVPCSLSLPAVRRKKCRRRKETLVEQMPGGRYCFEYFSILKFIFSFIPPFFPAFFQDWGCRSGTKVCNFTEILVESHYYLIVHVIEFDF